MTHASVAQRIAITGATGLIGRALARALRADGARVVTLGRDADADVRWDFQSDLGGTRREQLEALDGVVHLAGAPIARRWTLARRREIRSSRVNATMLLARALADLRSPPRVLVSGSAVGIYGDRGDAVLTEDSACGTGFLADLARAWEGATRAAEEAGVRVVHLRTGVVLARDGGALGKMLPPFRLGLGGPLGHGRQWMSWIALHDALRAILFSLSHDLRGPINAVAPNPARNADFTRALGAALSRPAVIPVPAIALRVIFGEMADATLLASQRALPERLLAAGFTFTEPELPGAIRRALNGM